MLNVHINLVRIIKDGGCWRVGMGDMSPVSHLNVSILNWEIGRGGAGEKEGGGGAGGVCVWGGGGGR